MTEDPVMRSFHKENLVDKDSDKKRKVQKYSKWS